MGHVVKNVVTFGRRFAGPLLYSDMRVLSPPYPTVIRPLTEGRIAAMFAGDRDTMRRFFWGGSAREVASGSRKSKRVTLEKCESILAIKIASYGSDTKEDDL